MTALEAFAKRHASRPAVLFLAGVIGVGMFAGSATGFTSASAVIPKHPISEDSAGTDLLRAADARVADQFGDMKRVLAVVDQIADEPIRGADKMRAVTQAARHFAATTPDEGAAAHDKNLFAVAKGVTSIAFEVAVDELNQDKLELAQASLALRKIQTAMVVGDEEAVGNGMIDMETAIERYEARHAAANTGTTASNPIPIGFVTEAVKHYVELDRAARIEVEIQHRRIDVSR